MRGTPTRYVMKSGQYGPYALGKFRDDQNTEVDMIFSGGKNSPLPNENLVGIPTIWAVKWDANKQKYSALFNSYAGQAHGQPGPVNPYGSQNAQQAPQGGPGRPNAAQMAQDTKSTSIERQAVAKAVLGSPKCPDDLGLIVKWCCIVHKWVETGKDIPVPDPDGHYYDNSEQAPPPQDDDIPWE